ncbi:MAG: DUF389 domain-containing protein [Muribaculaceae bacterium]|nr:DUF389 domain-containing protein [Muribaculaceae bacterium]
MKPANIIQQVREYFNLLPDKETEEQTIEQISKGVSFRGANLWVLMLAILIASLGLNVNSTAVIIGAMLISPLMGPIIGMGLAVGINDLSLLRRSAKNYGVATLISVLTATVYFLLSPLGDAQSELLARTSPSLYDVLIAFFGGAAGILAISTKGKGNVIPGVAIATALMPPLCTAGYGLAKGQWLYFVGAFYLFFINTVFICLATYVGVRLLNFGKKADDPLNNTRRNRRIITAIVVATVIPAAFFTINIVQKNILDNNVKRFVASELRQSGTQVLSSVVSDNKELRVVAVGKEISHRQRKEARSRMGFYGLDGFTLKVIQGTQGDSLLAMTEKLNVVENSGELARKQVLELTSRNSELERRVSAYERYAGLTSQVASEIKSLFPQVSSLSVMPVTEASIADTVTAKKIVVAIIGTSKPMADPDKNRLHNWLRARCSADSLQLRLTQD